MMGGKARTTGGGFQRAFAAASPSQVSPALRASSSGLRSERPFSSEKAKKPNQRGRSSSLPLTPQKSVEQLEVSGSQRGSVLSLLSKMANPPSIPVGTAPPKTPSFVEAMAKAQAWQKEMDQPMGPPAKEMSPEKELPAEKPVGAACCITERFEKNEAKWFQDNQGRTVRVEATLRKTYEKLKRSSQEISSQTAAAARGEASDSGGHIVAHRFMGDQGPKNLFPQDSHFNNSAYKTMENELADWTKAGKEVHIKIKLLPPGADRPDTVQVKYKVLNSNGKEVCANSAQFNNNEEQTFKRIKSEDMANF